MMDGGQVIKFQFLAFVIVFWWKVVAWLHLFRQSKHDRVYPIKTRIFRLRKYPSCYDSGLSNGNTYVQVTEMPELLRFGFIQWKHICSGYGNGRVVTIVIS